MTDEGILMLGPLPPQVGGMESFITYLLHTDLAKTYRIHTLNMSKPGVNREKMPFATLMGYERSFRRGWGVTLRSYGYSFLFFLRFLGKLSRHRIRLLHIHTASHTNFWEKCAYIGLAKVLGKKVVLHVHGSQFALFYHQSRRPAQFLIKTFLSACDRVVALSQSWYDFFVGFLPPEKVALVRNGIDLTDYEKNSFRRSLEPSVAFLGEVGTRKGIFDLIESARQLQQNGDCPHFHIIGPGAIAQARQRAAEKGVGSYFHFHGSLHGREKIECLASAWCFVLPTYAEGMPLSILEAYAVGLPVISTCVGGIPEMIEQGVNGFVVQPGDTRGVASALRCVLQDSELRSCISRTNRQKAFANYNISLCAEQIDKIYRELLNA